ncbi:MAG: ABC transporter permease, partial [Gemmatimonadaceae bacterium]
MASIAIAIGPIVVASSVFEAAFLRDMAVKDSRDLLSIRTAHKGIGAAQIVSQGLSYPDYQDFQATLPKDSWRYMTAWKVEDVSRSGMTGDQPLRIATVSGDYFRIANARFTQGYAPSDQEIGVVVTPALWRELSAGRATAALTIYNQQFQVVGVVDESFHGLYANEGINAWIPLSALPRLEGNLNVLSYREQQDLSVIVQTAKESKIQSYQPLVATISSRLSEFHDANRFAWHFEMARAQPTFLELLRTQSGQAAFAPLLVVICVLLIAATNVANLFVIRATSRERELQLRLALGIQRKHLLLYQCLEPIVLGLAGLLVGLWMGILAVQRLTIHPALQHLHLQSSATAIVAAACAALLFVGLCVIMPVIRIGNLREAGMIHEGQGITSRGVSRLQQSFLVLQFTLALAFTCVAVQLASAVRQQSAVDVGFDTRNLLVIKGARDALGLTPERLFSDYQRVTAAVSSIPGVVAVSASLSEFFGGYRMMTRAIMTSPTTNLSWEGGVSAAMDAIGPGYFAALGLPLSAGREFGSEDRPGTPGRVIVNQALAKLIAPNGRAVG